MIAKLDFDDIEKRELMVKTSETLSMISNVPINLDRALKLISVA